MERFVRKPPRRSKGNAPKQHRAKAESASLPTVMPCHSTTFIAVAALALSLSACTPAEERRPGDFRENNKTTAGTLIGAAGGALIGSQIGGGSGRIAAAVAGTMIGGFIGHQVGESLDRDDVEHARAAQQRAYAAPVGQEISWKNPGNGHSGTITPTRDGKDAAGNSCREYQMTINVGGETQKAYGTACRQADGSWKVVNN